MPARFLGRGPRFNDARGLAMVIAAAFAATRGLAYLPGANDLTALPSGITMLTANTPLEVWAGLWFLTAAICLVCAFREKDWPGYAAVIAMSAMWAVAYVIGWAAYLAGFTDMGDREWLTAGTYGFPWMIIAILSMIITSGRSNKPVSRLP